MFRRSKAPLITAALVIALSAGATGCATFSDSDAIARVDDTKFTQDALETQLTELGATDEDALNAEPVRGLITEWIVEQLAALPVDTELLRTTYEQGAAASGAVCLAGIVVADQATAETVAADIEAGTPFADAFEESNIDQQLAATAGTLPCIAGPDLESEGVPFLAAAIELTADERLATAPLLDQAGTELAWVVIQFRSFDDLTDEDLAVVNGTQSEGVDIYVDPRYGTFDRTLSQVVALG